MENLQKVAFRKNGLLLAAEWIATKEAKPLDQTTLALLANGSKLGYTFSEELLQNVNRLAPKHKLAILDWLKEIRGVDKNWTPLVKQWDIPTGESAIDHIVTWFANVFKTTKDTKLPCGHIIPEHTFPLERYNGCPFCGTPFVFEELHYSNPEGKLTVLTYWTENHLQNYMVDLLESPVALDATQAEDLKMLLQKYEVANQANIKMKETLMLAADILIEQKRDNEAGQLFKQADDILRYLWYKHTGFLQVIRPKTIIARRQKNERTLYNNSQKNETVVAKYAAELKLKYSRAECRRYASWLNSLF